MAGRLDGAFYVERASTDAQRVLPAAEVDEAGVPYFSLAIVPEPEAPATSAGRPATSDTGAGGRRHRIPRRPARWRWWDSVPVTPTG